MEIDYGLVSGGLMVLGYIVYIIWSLRDEINPNPITWLMFSYGTILLTALEWDRLGGVEWSGAFFGIPLPHIPPVLYVPVACSTLGLVVAYLCARRGQMRWPKDKAETISFITDIFLTVGYLSAWGALSYNLISEANREFTALIFLLVSNAGAITAFTPIISSTYQKPGGERALPWLIWSASYALLGVLTLHEEGFWTELMVYPVLNTILHGAVGLLALPHRRKRQRDRELAEGFNAFG